MQAQLQKRRIVFQARWKVCTVCTLPEENLLSGPLCMLNEEHFPLTIVSARRTNGKSRYERVARLDDPHSRMTCRCCREHSLVAEGLQQTVMLLMLGHMLTMLILTLIIFCRDQPLVAGGRRFETPKLWLPRCC